MWRTQILHRAALSLYLSSSFFILTESLGTFQGRQRVIARQRRAATKWSQPVYTPTGGYGGNNVYQQQNLQQPQASASYSTGQTSPTYQYSAYPATAATYQQYAAPAKNSAYSTAGQSFPVQSNSYATYPGSSYAARPYSSANPGYVNPASGVMAGGYFPNGNPSNSFYNPQHASPYMTPNAFGNKNPGNGAVNPYPLVQSKFAKSQYAQPGSPEYNQGNYGLYQDPARTPMQYNFNGFNPYAQQNNGDTQRGYNQYGAGQGRAAQTAPLVTPAPELTAQQYNLAEFCQKPDREPKCKKNAFGMCDAQDNYPSEVATEFYAYYKSRITAMTTDYEYTSSDQYDTGFATQQNKLIDFVHDIFDDNEYGSLPGVPTQKKGLCVGVSDTVQPGWAKSAHGKNYVVMNSNKIKQTVRAEVCKNVGKGCQTVPKCYKSECRQRYRYDTLLVFDPCDAKRAPMLELFKIPDGCECFVLVEEPELGDDSAVSASVTKRQPPTSATVPPSTLSTTVPTASGRSGDFTTAAITTQFTTPKTTVAATTIASTSKTSSATTDQTSAPKQIIILSPR